MEVVLPPNEKNSIMLYFHIVELVFRTSDSICLTCFITDSVILYKLFIHKKTETIWSVEKVTLIFEKKNININSLPKHCFILI